MVNSCPMPNPDKCGNMYFRSTWEFCPEYHVGNVVLHNGLLYLAINHNSGKDPKDNPEYWICLGGIIQPPKLPRGRIILDGGYASSSPDDSFCERAVDGGGAGDCINIPLV